MARYDYVCPAGHVTEVERPIGSDLPGRVDCEFVHYDVVDGETRPIDGGVCGLSAERQYSAPAIRGDRVLHHGRPRSAT